MSATREWAPRTQRKRGSPPIATGGPLRGKSLALAAAIGVALTGLGGFLLLAGEDGARPPESARDASVAELRALAEEAATPIYWAGTAPGTRFEVTETAGGKVFVRYLPANVEVGDGRSSFLTVGTYPYRRAYAVADRASEQKGMASAQAPGGGLAVWSEKRPSSVYVAYPGSERLVEVFSPNAAKARRLVFDGEVGPVDRERAEAQVAPSLAPLDDLRP